MSLTLDKKTGLVTNVAHITSLGLTDGGRPMPTRRCVVIHYTEGGTALSSVDWWKQPQNRKIDLGAHFIIDRDGTIYQVRACNRTISHAGVSRWKDPRTGKLHKNCNGFAIGIELANAGSEVGHIKGLDKLPGYAGSTRMKHRNGGVTASWEVYPQPQWEACNALCQLLVRTYNLDDVTGHDCIAPERKTDPGPAFDGRMKWIRDNCGFGFTLPEVHRA